MRTTSAKPAPPRSRACFIFAKHWRASASKPPCTIEPEASRPPSPGTKSSDFGPKGPDTAALNPRSRSFLIRRKGASALMIFPVLPRGQDYRYRYINFLTSDQILGAQRFAEADAGSESDVLPTLGA